MSKSTKPHSYIDILTKSSLIVGLTIAALQLLHYIILFIGLLINGPRHANAPAQILSTIIYYLSPVALIFCVIAFIITVAYHLTHRNEAKNNRIILALAGLILAILFSIA